MRDQMEMFIVLPFSIGCVSETSIAVIKDTQKKPIATDHSTPQKDKTYRQEEEKLEGEEEKRVKNSSGFLSLQRQNTSSVLQKLMRSFTDLAAQIFLDKEEEEKEEEKMEIGFPTDVQHVGHIGWDGFNKAPQLLSLPSISFRQFEFAMVDQEDCNGKRNLAV